MMNILEEAIIYATVMHQGKIRKFYGHTLYPPPYGGSADTLHHDKRS